VTTTHALERFVPGHVLARIGREGALVSEVEGTLCFIDISGFTALSERLAAKGRVGAEELTEVLGRVFGDMLDLVAARGGTLLKFGGDALLLLFEGPDHAMQATCAAVEMRAALRKAAEIPTSVGKVALRMSVGLHSGAVHLFTLTGTHRELIVAGPSSSRVNLMEGTADAGEIVVSSATRELLPDGAAGDPKGEGWLLRWRTSKAGVCGIPAFFEDTVAEPEDYVPTALRAHLEAGAPDSEHRLATVVFVKVLGIDDHIADVGADVTARALQELIANVTAIADEQEVTFLATDVDANAFKIILVAGVPVTSIDEDGKALRAARKIADLTTPFDLKLGVNRGHVFSGEIGTSERSTYTIMGDTVNLAARLMAAAPAGAVYASPEVVNGSTTLFASEAVEPFHVKGKSQPVHALALGEETGTRTAREARVVAFVGREAELAILRGAVANLEKGTGGAFAVTGPTGIGKTRTVEEAVQESDVDTIEVRAEPYGAANPYRPFRDPARHLLGIERADNDEMAAQLLATLEARAPQLLALAPLLGDITQVDVPSTEESAAIDPQFRQDRAIDLFVEALQAVHPDPVIIVGEDMHWADAASQGLMERLAVEAHHQPWLVIQTCRNRIQQDAVTTLPLEPLDDATMRTLIHAATEAAPLLPDMVDAVIGRSGGSPLFALELLKVARDTGDIDSLPTSLDGIVGSQIDRLEPLPRRVLGYLAVLGRSFRTSVAREFLQSQGVELDEATRERLSDFIEQDGPRRLQFRHALVRDTAYEGLSFRRRQALHLEAARMILGATHGSTDAVADILGLHFYLGHDARRAWEYCRTAGDRNRERYANREAATQYVRALEASRSLADVAESERRELLVKLGDVLQSASDFEGSIDAYRRAASLSRDDPAAQVEVLLRRARAKERMGSYSTALADVTRAVNAMRGRTKVRRVWLAEALSQSAAIRQAQQKPRDALERAHDAERAARESGDDLALARAWAVMDWAHYMLGQADLATYSAGALEIYEREGRLDSAASVSVNLGGFAFYAGDWDGALRLYRTAGDLADRAGNTAESAVAMSNIGELLVNQGRYDEAAPVLEDARRTFVASGFADLLAFTDLQLGRLYRRLGDLSRSRTHLESALGVARDLGIDGWILEARMYLAHTECQAGQTRLALTMLGEARAAAPPDYVDLYAVTLARITGSILEADGDTHEAIQVLERGLSTAKERSDSYEAALITLQIEHLAPGRIPDDVVQEANETLRTLGVRAERLGSTELDLSEVG
jgi:class 3 adenylate cyclase/tetratricopeptide (TPR) repeat protein